MHTPLTSYVYMHTYVAYLCIYAYLYCIYVLVKEGISWFMKEAFLAQKNNYNSFLHCDEPIGTFIWGLMFVVAKTMKK